MSSPTNKKRSTKEATSIALPAGCTKLLLHSCCATCSGSIIERIHSADIKFTIFFYNPNIHPRKEYEKRKQENILFAKRLGIEFVDADYDVQNWFARTKGLEHEPERGKRCSKCFDMRMERTALYAYEHGFDVFTTSLGISRWKNQQQVNDSGKLAASRYEGVEYWDINWRKNGGSTRMYELAKEEGFYRQQYCGCTYSLRDTNKWRIANGKEAID